MSLNHIEIASVVQELVDCLVPSRLLKINSPTTSSCQLVLQADGKKKFTLFLSLTPQLTCLHLVSTKAPSLRTPPAWIMKLRKELVGMTLGSIDQKKDDRVVMLRFMHKGPRPNRTLMAILFDKIGQLLLLDEHELSIFSAIGNHETGQIPAIPESRVRGSKIASRFPAANTDYLTVNRAVEKHYSDLQRQKTQRARKRVLARFIYRERNKLSRRLEKMHKDFTRAEQAPSLLRQAQALKANLNKAIKGQHELVLDDPYHPGGDPVVISLNPALTPTRNMQRLFERSKRLQEALNKIQVRIQRAEARLEQLDRLASDLDHAVTVEEIENLQKDLAVNSLIIKKRADSGKQPRLPYKAYRSVKGLLIYVGRSAADNHTLTFRVAKGQDLWLHARERSGAHVIVRIEPNQQVDEQTLLDAATLAAEAAGAKPEDKCEVTYTKVKNVHTIKGAPPGLVSVAKSRTILVRIEPERIKRLHNHHPPPCVLV